MILIWYSRPLCNAFDSSEILKKLYLNYSLYNIDIINHPVIISKSHISDDSKLIIILCIISEPENFNFNSKCNLWADLPFNCFFCISFYISSFKSCHTPLSLLQRYARHHLFFVFSCLSSKLNTELQIQFEDRDIDWEGERTTTRIDMRQSRQNKISLIKG